MVPSYQFCRKLFIHSALVVAIFNFVPGFFLISCARKKAYCRLSKFSQESFSLSCRKKLLQNNSSINLLVFIGAMLFYPTESYMHRAGFTRTFPCPPDTNFAKNHILICHKHPRMVYIACWIFVLLISSVLSFSNIPLLHFLIFLTLYNNLGTPLNEPTQFSLSFFYHYL